MLNNVGPARGGGRGSAARPADLVEHAALGEVRRLLLNTRPRTIVTSLVATAKLSGVEPLAWLTDVLGRVVSGRTRAHELARLPPWAWQAERLAAAVNAWTP